MNRGQEPGGQMTFFEHLSELRKRIINSLYAIGIGAFVGVGLSKYAIKWITTPIIKALTDAHQIPHLYYTHPAGYLNTYHAGGVPWRGDGVADCAVPGLVVCGPGTLQA